MTTANNQSPPPTVNLQLEESLDSVRKALTDLKYGSIALTIHDGRIVQIDVTEKTRIKPS